MKRYTIEFSIREIDDEGNDLGETDGVTMDWATTERLTLVGIMDEVYEYADCVLYERVVGDSEDVITPRRPEEES